MKTKITRLLLSAVLMMCCMVANAVGTQPSGEGTSGNPYQIATKDNLLWFAEHVNQGNLTACAILTADITVNNGVLDSNGDLNSGTFETWIPIGSWGSEPNTYKGFAGEFNGGGHTISGLYFNDATKAPVGLFGMADQNGYIHDVGIKDSYFRAKSHVAGICGDLAYGRIENCWNGATVQSAEGTTGGIAGSCWHSSSISGCYNIGKVSSINSNVCGGICGSASNVTYSVSNCVSLEGKCEVAYNIGEDGAQVSNVFMRDASAFASGDVCWILNGEKIDTKWRQQIGTDSYPVWTGNYLVNYYNGSSSYYYNETMCEKSSNGIHNFEKITIKGCTGDTFYYWHCTHCGNDYSYEGDGGHKNQTKEWSPSSGAHSPEWVQAVLPTATTEGRYGHWHCRLCGKDFLDEQCTVEATDAVLTVPVAKNNEIWYTTTDNKKLTPYTTNVFGATYNDANNVYERGLGKITFDKDVTSIGEYAFTECSSLKSISVPNSVTSIGNYAFIDCSSLKSISVPNSVTSIGERAFYKCSQLQSITIPGSVKSMGRSVFSYCTSLEDVTIEDGAYIGENMLSNYKGNLTINGSLSGVGEYAFNGCTVLTSVSIKGGDIGRYAFKGCINLGSVTLHDGVTGIGEYAFTECSSLKSISVPNSVTSIGGYAFNKCSQLQSITIPGSVKSMGWNVFDNCSSLNNVTIEDGAYIGDYAFQNYNGTLTINGSLSGVGEEAFLNCIKLTSVSIKSGGIGDYAFIGCTNLITVSLLDGVTGIGTQAFKTCSNLKDINVKWTKAENIPSITWNVFDGVDRAKATLHVPTNTTSLYQTKDIWKDFRIVEDVNFIITKTDDTTIGQKIEANGKITIDERSRNIKSLVVSEDVENVSVTYYRNFANAGKWQAWYVPFDVDVADMAQAGLDVAEIYGILLDNDNNAVIAFLKMNAGTVKANTPYVVRPKWYGDVTVTTTTTLYQTKPTQFAINSAKDTYTIGGIYEQTTTPGNWYAVNTSGQFQKMGTGVNLSPMRIWMTIDPRDDNPYTQPSEANAKMNIMVIGDDESTGIESLAPTLSESKGTIYNLSGQRVTSIQKGQVYIMNGKKFFAR